MSGEMVLRREVTRLARVDLPGVVSGVHECGGAGGAGEGEGIPEPGIPAIPITAAVSCLFTSWTARRWEGGRTETLVGGQGLELGVDF